MSLDERQLDRDGVPIAFEEPGQVTVRIEPSGGKAFKEPAIPLDGRTYICAGTIILPDDRTVRAQFELDTSARRILVRRSVWITLDSHQWYLLEDRQVHGVLGISRSSLKSWRWMPDRPLADCPPGPYPAGWVPDR